MKPHVNTLVKAFKQQPTARLPLIILKETLFKIFQRLNIDRMYYL